MLFHGICRLYIARIIQAQFAVVEGQSAALDLMESFGFEGGVEPTSPTDPSTNSLPFDVTVSHSEPTLLDLTLPNSPSEDMQEGY